MANVVTQQLIDQILITKDQALAINLLLSKYEDHDKLLTFENIIKLGYIRMHSLSVERLIDLMEQSILLPYEIENFDLADEFEQFIDQYNYIPEEIALCRTVLHILGTNKEMLSNAEIVLQGKKQPGTVGNWLADYIDFTQTQSLLHDALGVTKYFASNRNVKLLSEHQQYTLKSLFKLFAYCEKNIQLWEMLPEEIDEDNLPPQFNKQDIDMALLGFDDIDELWVEDSNVIENLSQPIVMDMQRIAPSTDKELIRDITPKQIEQSHTQQSIGVQDAVTPTHLKPEEEAFRIANNTDAVQQQKRGLVFDEPTNINLSEVEAAAKKQEQKQRDIASKLEELKKRKPNHDQ